MPMSAEPAPYTGSDRSRKGVRRTAYRKASQRCAFSLAARCRMNPNGSRHAVSFRCLAAKHGIFGFRTYIILCRKQNFNTVLQFFYFFPSFFRYCPCIRKLFCFSVPIRLSGALPAFRHRKTQHASQSAFLKNQRDRTGSVLCGEALCRSPPFILPLSGNTPSDSPPAYQYRSFPERYASSSSIGIRTCSIVSLSRTVTQ